MRIVAADPNRWPRRLRITLVAVATAIVLGAGLYGYRYFSQPVVLTVAAGSIDGEALSLISAISARLASSGSHIRLKVVDSGSALKAARMLTAGEANLAVVRGDTGDLTDARTILLLTHGVVMILVPSASSAESITDLRNMTVGVIGGEVNHPVLAALAEVYQLDRAKVRFEDVTIDQGRSAFSSGKIQAILVVAPLTGKYLAAIKAFFQQRNKTAIPKLIAIESAGAIANVAPAYESFDIPKGTLRGSPPVPSDDLTTLQVPVFLVAGKTLGKDTATELTDALIKARRDLLTEYPILAQAGAPSTDADALIPIHPGAQTYYNGEEQSFLDEYSDKIYYAFLLLGTLGSAIVAAWRFASFGSKPTNLVEELYALGHEIQAAKSELELDAIEQKIDEFLKTALARSASGDGDGADTGALNLAAHRLQYLMKYRRDILRQSQSAGSPADARTQQHRNRAVTGDRVEVDPTS
jgi:TRAP-type uncharacterized transport system substrate-binding protein